MSVNLACGSHKTPDGNNFQKKGSFQFSKSTVHHGREVTWQEREAVGHVAPSQKADSWYLELTFSFLFNQGPQPIEWC